MEDSGLWLREHRILSSETDSFRRLRLSALLTMLQEAAISHTTELGMGREKTLDQGLLWVVSSWYLRIRRLPFYDENVILESTPGRTMHLFFPRYFQMKTKEEELLLEASSLWLLMDEKSRKMAFPEEYGIQIEGTDRPDLPVLPRRLKREIYAENRHFQLPFSFCDLNGHMNNTRAFDLAEDLMSDSLRARSPKEVTVEYAGETRPGEELLLRFEEGPGSFSLAGQRDGKDCFRMKMLY